jgi:exosome complex component RRP41
MKKRKDNRKADEPREIKAEVGIIKRATGSAMFKIGDTVAIAAVYGPRSLHPKYLQNPEKGILRCNYNMMAFSGSGERIRPGPSRRSREISMVIGKALEPAVELHEFPDSVVDIFIEITQSDSGTRCAGICAASLALADAGVPMKDLVSAIALGRIGNDIFVDVTKEEEDIEGMADVPVAFMPNSGKVTLLQCDGFLTKEQLKQILELGKKVCMEIYKIQKKALKEKYIK